MTQTVRTRFAPSPTGFMHIGNLRSGLYGFLFARHNGGNFILRIEDTDQERFVEGAVDMIYSTLKKAGIDYDEGPNRDGGYGPYVQSERKALYLEYARKLVELGGAYYCFCDKERLESLTDENGVRKYDKHCLSLSKEEVERRLAAGEPYVIRQNIPSGEGSSTYVDMVYGEVSVAYADMEDNILLKSDGMPTYNFANVVDDHLMGITHVMRGSEYLSSTPKYNLIYDSFGWQRPNYIHMPPIMRDAQHKLSKRHGDANFEDFLEKGFLPEAIVNYVALLGWSPKGNQEKMTLAELIEAFSVDGISSSPSIFDEAKLRWLNGEYIKAMTPSELATRAKEWFERSKVAGKYDYEKLAKLLLTRIDVLSDIPEKVDFLEEFGEYDVALYLHQKMKVDFNVAKNALKVAISALEGVSEWTEDSVHQSLTDAAEANQMKKGQVLWSVRVALTGQASTPGGAIEMADVLGKEQSMSRLRFSLRLLEDNAPLQA